MAAVIREGVTGAEVHHIEGRIVGGGSPNRSSTALPTGAGPRGGGSGPEPPQELPRGRAVSVQMTAHSFIGAGNANNHFWHRSLAGADELRSKGQGSAVG